MKQSDTLSPTFVLALVLSLLVFLLANIFTNPGDHGFLVYSFEVLKFWQKGFWELLEFTMQMVLILIFGHALAISTPIARFLNWLSSGVRSNTHAVLLTGFTAMFAGYVNWGFGLILGAILAKEVAIQADKSGVKINYPLVAASGYLGMLIWHGGLSGSAPLKVAEKQHFLSSQIGVISVSETLFSNFNLGVNLVLLAGLFIIMCLLSKGNFSPKNHLVVDEISKPLVGKDKVGLVLGIIILGLSISDIAVNWGGFSFIDLNYVNFTLMGLGMLAFGSLTAYIKAITIAVSGSVEILLQFPFYAGILGIMKYSGLLVLISEAIVYYSTAETFPVLAFFSAAFVNFFIPSGGGQWAIQGPVIMDATLKLGLDPSRMVMVFAYGDQVSNMLQPFWALPLLAITGVAAKDILKYTLYFFGLAILVFAICIYFFLP
ncbi:TIGR00366 family protein [Belliella pelovolcani]|uniref:Short-chain fatty acids transporter n=1 Tax=Belliella pelovolcani TaxID=529505 RepID=A0A1N7PG61_9BACT|nr:TIGR00366 family protein [Belliella pelovolcani]SIT09643.1 short-chain fatty acids transporter [Belliella pelovolcani]